MVLEQGTITFLRPSSRSGRPSCWWGRWDASRQPSSPTWRALSFVHLSRNLFQTLLYGRKWPRPDRSEIHIKMRCILGVGLRLSRLRWLCLPGRPNQLEKLRWSYLERSSCVPGHPGWWNVSFPFQTKRGPLPPFFLSPALRRDTRKKMNFTLQWSERHEFTQQQQQSQGWNTFQVGIQGPREVPGLSALLFRFLLVLLQRPLIHHARQVHNLSANSRLARIWKWYRPV